MKATLPLATLGLLCLGATHSEAIPSLMTSAEIVAGRPVFPTPMPSLMVADSSVVELISTNGPSASLNLVCKFQTYPILGLMVRRINVVVRGFSRAPVIVEGFNLSTRSWGRLGTANMPNNLTRVTFGFDITSPIMASRFISPFGEMIVRLRRSDTRQFSVYMDCVGVETLY